MKKLILMAAAAGVLMTVPAMAESVVIGTRGAAVTIRDNDHRDHWRERRHWREHRAECREVTVRSRRPDGTVVIRKSRSC